MGNYAKFVVAALFAIAQFVLYAYGVDISEAISGVLVALGALGVLVVPNAPVSTGGKKRPPGE